MAVAYLATPAPGLDRLSKIFPPTLSWEPAVMPAGPVVRKAAQMGIKTVTHEQTRLSGCHHQAII